MRASLLVVVALLAGCAAPAAQQSASVVSARILPTGHAAGEPSIGVTKDGSIFVVANDQVVRSSDQGASWTVVHDFEKARGEPSTSDPWLTVDTVTDRVIVDQMFPILTCTLVFWSDDAGKSFSNGAPACATPVVDFQKIVAGVPGPSPNGEAGKSWKSVWYMCYNKPVYDFATGAAPVAQYGFACSSSYDGGVSWKNEQMLSREIYVAGRPAVAGCGGGSWGPAVSPKGVVVARAQPDCMFRSMDSGASWQLIGKGPPFAGTQFAFGADGALYALSAYWMPPLQLARSLDDGATWEGPWTIQPPEVGTVAFPALVAGDAGRVAVAFLGTSEVVEDAQKASESAKWHAWFVTTSDANAAKPRFDSFRATSDDAPMHVGCISRARPCPWMGDFVTMAMGPDGTPFVVFPDTCNEGCEGKAGATMKDTTRASATVVALDGWSLKAT